MSQVIEVKELEELEPFRLAWRSLLANTPGGSFFQSLDWLRAYWRHFGADQRLRVLVVCSRGSVIGILPLTVITEKTRLGRLPTLTYPLHDWGSYYGPIGPNPTATLIAGLRHLQQTQRDWRLLDLRWTDKEMRDRGRTPAAMQAVGWPVSEGLWKRLAVVNTRGCWTDYEAALAARFRQNLRRCRRRAQQAGRLEFTRVRPLGSARGDDDPRWDLYDACVELARRSWQGASEDGTTLSHEAVAGFLRETHELAAQAGAVEMNLLTLDGRPLAFTYNYHCQGYVLGLRAGYDPQFAPLSPGNLLYAEMIRDSFRRDDHTIDLGPGRLGIKRHWMTSLAASYRYTYYPTAAAQAQLLRLKHWLSRQRVGEPEGITTKSTKSTKGTKQGV